MRQSRRTKPGWRHDEPADEPPVLTVPIVRAHRLKLEAELVELRGTVPAAALAVARKEPASIRALVALRRKIADVEFQIAANRDAAELAAVQDHAAASAWRAQIQTLPPEQIISGIGNGFLLQQLRARHGRRLCDRGRQPDDRMPAPGHAA